MIHFVFHDELPLVVLLHLEVLFVPRRHLSNLLICYVHNKLKEVAKMHISHAPQFRALSPSLKHPYNWKDTSTRKVVG